jgi:amino acid transporter
MEFSEIYNWFMGLGEPYGVNPVIFGSIYVGAVPFFWAAIAWLVHNIRKKRSITGPVIMACACAISAYVYLIFAGENVPLWVYGLIVAIIVYAIYSTLKKVKRKKEELLNEASV